MAPFRILSLDGGGIRGVLTARLLERIVANSPDFLTRVDLIAGTSTGGILALGLAAGIEPGRLRRFYEEKGPKIFGSPRVYLAHAKYKQEPLRAALREVLGELKLGDLTKSVLISSFDLQKSDGRWAPKFFHNLPGSGSNDGGRLAWEVALYTSAAPIYFPVEDGYIDGGVIANNPCMAAVAQTRDARYFDPPVGPHELRVVSLGTGDVPKSIRGDDLDWGLSQWGHDLRIVDVIMEGGMDAVDYYCRQIVGEDYYRRFNVRLTEEIAMDDHKKIPELIRAVDGADLGDLLRWIGENWSEDADMRTAKNKSPPGR